MKFGIIYFPWTTGFDSLEYVLEEIMEQETVKLWHKNADAKSLASLDGLFLPDGFSDPHIIHTTRLVKSSPIIDLVHQFAANGGFVLGVNNGFQILCEIGMLPGQLTQNIHKQFVCKNTFVRSECQDSHLTLLADSEQPLILPIAHSVGRYQCTQHELERLNQNEQVLFRYCTEVGMATPESNPDGSLDNIAAICNINRNVYGIMPLPERAADDELGNMDGKLIFDSIVKSMQ